MNISSQEKLKNKKTEHRLTACVLFFCFRAIRDLPLRNGYGYFGRPMAAPTIYSDMSVALPYLLFLHYYLLLNYKPLRHFLTKMPPPLNGRLI